MNQQIPMGADQRSSGAVIVHSMFKTIQGEGPYCGERALFIRLFGCNLRCPGCDTEYTSTNESYYADGIVAKVQEMGWPHGALIVVTGGEPFRQNIVPMIDSLILAGYRVQIETNGVLWLKEMEQLVRWYSGTRKPFLTIVCSPKTNRIHERIFETADAFKYVLQAGDVREEDGLPIRALGHTANPYVARPRKGALVYVQPMDEGDEELNRANLAAAIESTMAHGYRLQIQVHKLIGVE